MAKIKKDIEEALALKQWTAAELGFESVDDLSHYLLLEMPSPRPDLKLSEDDDLATHLEKRRRIVAESDAPPPDPLAFFAERGVRRDVVLGRPYGRWTPKFSEPLQEAWFPFCEGKSGLKRWVTNIARQEQGFIIPRYVPPGIEAPELSAEIRPFAPVETRPGNPAKYIHVPVKGQAMRIDMHPDAVPLFENATRVFFGIEGCIKEDAMLSQGEATLSVPAVWQWRAPEMGQVVEKYLKGKTVFIVPDADWTEKWQVRSAAIQCASFLEGFGLEKVFVAAPPAEADLKGVDDFLGAGYGVDDLVVIGRRLPDAFEEWAAKIAKEGRIDAAARDAEVLQALSLSAGITEDQDGKKVEEDGEVFKAISPLANMVSTINPKRKFDRKRVREALEALATRPGLSSESAITIEGSLDITDGEFHGGVDLDSASEDYADRWWGDKSYREYDWSNRPRITVAPELRARDREPISVGELMENLTPDSMKRHGIRTRDCSVEALRELRGSSSA